MAPHVKRMLHMHPRFKVTPKYRAATNGQKSTASRLSGQVMQ